VEKGKIESYEDLANHYQTLIEEASEEIKILQRRIHLIGTLRLALVVVAIALLVGFRSSPWEVWGVIVAAATIPYIWLMRKHARAFKERDYWEADRRVSEEELAAVNGDYSAFDGGKEFIDPAHPYTYDLDVFGDNSLFQMLNRTCTYMGKKLLAEQLMHQTTDKEEIMQRQKGATVTCDSEDFRRELRIQGLLYKGAPGDEAELKAWVEEPNVFIQHKGWLLAPVVVGLINAVSITLAFCGIVSWTSVGVVWMLFALFSFLFTARVGKVQAAYSKKLRILELYAHLLEVIEDGADEDPPLNMSSNIRQLRKRMDVLDQRNNMFVYALLNGLFLWELWEVLGLELWKVKHAADLPEYLALIASVEVCCSTGTFAFNHPDYTYPTISEQPFRLEAEAMGHPLMNRDRCVPNDINIPKRPFFLVVTGANMAGKSTYLRTIGVNYLLASLGVPVYARSMTFYPARLITGLRTSDSLNDNESYFFAELKRLKMIIDRLQAGEQLFVLLDEILKGTNSVDKQKGSMALMHQLMALQANGIIATHDLMLGSLKEAYPDNIRNCCFEADITNDNLTFTYKLRDGVAQNMNASFLMNKMGITV
jgi:hypothetical protein